MNAPSIFSVSEKHRTKVAVYETWLTRAPGRPAKYVEADIAERFCLSVSTVRRYIKEIDENGYAPVQKGKQGRSVFAWDDKALNFMRAFYLAASRDVGYCSKRNAYKKTLEAALQNGWRVGSEPSAYKHLEDIHALLLEYARGGKRALDNLFYIARDLSSLKPFEVIVGDQHRFDFWVLNDKGEKFRPECYAWLDMRTRLPYGIAFEAGPYNFRTVARSLRSGIVRFGKFNSTYNDNGKPETAKKIDWLVEALQTFGMKYTDEAELYKTEDGKYAIEDDTGTIVAVADTPELWHKKNRRIFAQVKNAKTKPIERFFRTLEVLLLDRCLPGYVRDLTSSAAEDEEANRRLNWQEQNGYLLYYDEFVEHVYQALNAYEQRTHAGLKLSPREELTKAIEKELWQPSFISPADIKYLFMEPATAKVRNNRVVVSGITYAGPNLTGDMVKQNRSNLAGLSGKKIEVRFDPDDPDSGAFAIDPRDKQPIFLLPETRIQFFDEAAVQKAIAQKRGNIHAVTSTYRQEVGTFGKVVTSTQHKQLEDVKAITQSAFTEELKLTDTELETAVGELLRKEQQEKPQRRPVYVSERARYEAILEALMDGSELTETDKTFKAQYEQTISPDEKLYFQNMIEIGLEARKEKHKWN